MRFYSKIKILVLLALPLVLLMEGCGLNNTKGQLVGVKGRQAWTHPVPYGW